MQSHPQKYLPNHRKLNDNPPHLRWILKWCLASNEIDRWPLDWSSIDPEQSRFNRSLAPIMRLNASVGLETWSDTRAKLSNDIATIIANLSDVIVLNQCPLNGILSWLRWSFGQLVLLGKLKCFHSSRFCIELNWQRLREDVWDNPWNPPSS